MDLEIWSCSGQWSISALMCSCSHPSQLGRDPQATSTGFGCAVLISRVTGLVLAYLGRNSLQSQPPEEVIMILLLPFNPRTD